MLVPGDLGALGWIALAYLGLTLIGALVSFADDYLSTWIGERFLLNLRLGSSTTSSASRSTSSTATGSAT